MQFKSARAKGFTLIELLVVMTVICVLLSIILPAIGRVRNMAVAIKCQGNVHTLTTAFLAFASDHGNCLPGADRTPYAQPFQLDWLMNNSNDVRTGTIWPYVNKQEIFLCPAMDTDVGTTGTNSAGVATAFDQYASNGRFDYGFFTIFNGSPLQIIPRTAQMIQLNGRLGTFPTPIICQEDGYQLNGYDVEGNHSNVDQMSHIHNGGSYYGSIDGSVTWVVEPDVVGYWGNGCWQWQCIGPSTHNVVNLGNAYGSWGSWSTF